MTMFDTGQQFTQPEINRPLGQGAVMFVDNYTSTPRASEWHTANPKPRKT